MRIAFYSPLASHLELALARGGDPVFLHNLLETLRARGHDVRVVSEFNVRDLWKGRVPKRTVVSEARRIRAEGGKFAPDGWLVYGVSRTYPDLFGWWQRAPRYVLFSAHTWQSKRIPKAWRPPLTFAFKRSLARADAIVATRPASAERLRARGVPQARLLVRTFAAEIPDELPPQEVARQRLGLPAQAPVLLCTTRFTGPQEAKEGKTEMILDLLAMIPSLPESAVLVLVGDGAGRERIEREAADLIAAGRVRIFDPVPSKELSLFHAASDFYAYPHPLDRPWMSVLEAQAHGKPVVTMRKRSGELTVDDGRSGLLANDLVEFRQLAGALAADRGRCEAMGQAARRYVEDNHSMDVRADEIESLLGSPGPGGARRPRTQPSWSAP
jgi:glycosyltransferase involved in cell wall biosynthesis